MYFEWWLILILIFIIGIIGYALGEDSGYTKGWIDRSKKSEYIDEEDE